MRTLLMAFRNIYRNKRRTLFTLLSIVLGIAGLVVFQGYIQSQMLGFRKYVVQNGLGHIQVAQSDKYFVEGEYNPFDYLIPDEANLTRELLGQAQVRSVIPALGFSGLAAFNDKTISLLLKAYPVDQAYFSRQYDDPADKGRSLVLGHLLSGTALTRNVTNGIMLGKKAASILKVKPGDVITILGLVRGGGMNGSDMTVMGIYEGSGGSDKYFAFCSYDFAKTFLTVDSPSVLLVDLKDIKYTDKVAAGLRNSPYLANMKIKTWFELATYFRQVNTMYDTFLLVIRFILLLVTVFVIVNTMTMTVFERTREIGTLRSLGCTRLGILVLFVWEGLLMGLLGSIAGIALGFGLCSLFNWAGGVPMNYEGHVLHVLFLPELANMLPNVIPVLIFSLLGSIPPALKASRLNIAETLHYV